MTLTSRRKAQPSSGSICMTDENRRLQHRLFSFIFAQGKEGKIEENFLKKLQKCDKSTF